MHNSAPYTGILFRYKEDVFWANEIDGNIVHFPWFPWEPSCTYNESQKIAESFING